MKTIKISKVYKTFEEFINSPEYNDMWYGWQGKAGLTPYLLDSFN